MTTLNTKKINMLIQDTLTDLDIEACLDTLCSMEFFSDDEIEETLDHIDDLVPMDELFEHWVHGIYS